MTEVSRQREAAIAELEQQLEALAEREKHLQQRTETLKKVPLPAVEYFASIVGRGEKRRAWRDYALFDLGVIVSTVVAIILGLVSF